MRSRQFHERLGVRALLGVVAAAVGEDPHDLDDVPGPLRVGERQAVGLGVAATVAAQGGEHRQGRVHRGERDVVAGALGGLAGGIEQGLAAVDVAAHPAHRGVPRQDLRFLGRIGAVQAGGLACRLALVEPAA